MIHQYIFCTQQKPSSGPYCSGSLTHLLNGLPFDAVLKAYHHLREALLSLFTDERAEAQKAKITCSVKYS